MHLWGWRLAGEVMAPAIRSKSYSLEYKSVIYWFQTDKSGTLWDRRSEPGRTLLKDGNISWFRILQLVPLLNLKPLLFSPGSDHSLAQSHCADLWPTGINAHSFSIPVKSQWNGAVSWVPLAKPLNTWLIYESHSFSWGRKKKPKKTNAKSEFICFGCVLRLHKTSPN